MGTLGEFWVFEDDAGKTFRNGKVFWPVYVTVRIDRRRALDLLVQIANSVRFRDAGAADVPIDIVFSGTLRRQVDGNEQEATP